MDMAHSGSQTPRPTVKKLAPIAPPLRASWRSCRKRHDPTPGRSGASREHGTSAIDAHPAVKHWVRNVERDERFSFWLPTATDYFYPDFVAELNDGRVLVVEYKGAHLLNADTDEKEQIGRQWAASSGGKCLFLLAVANDNGRDVAVQIAEKIG